MGRCPRCGYVLTYDGYRYFCGYCGYPRTHRPLTNALQDIDRAVRLKVRNFLQALKPDTNREIRYYPANILLQRPCVSCGVNFPTGLQSCPNCGTPRLMPPPDSQAPAIMPEPQGLDRRVLDYIMSHGGTISISQTVHDLSVTQDALRFSIERLKAAGFLKPS